MIVRSASAGRAVICQQTRAMSMFGSSIPNSPLDEEFPGLPVLMSSATGAPTTDQTTLANGVRVVSRDSHGPASKIGLFFGGGSRAETDQIRGASYLISKLAFIGRSTSKTGLRIVRDLEDAGAAGTASSGRESLSFTGTSLRTNVQDSAEGLAEVAFNSAFTPWDVAEAKEHAKNSIAASSDSDRQADAIFSAAFYDTETLGKPIMAPDNIGNLKASSVADFMGSLCDPSNLVVAGVDVAHSELVNLAEKYCGHLAAGTAPSGSTSEYAGGEVRVRGSGNSKVSLAFQGCACGSCAPFQVLAEVLGNGSLFSRGRGLGQGNTRLGKAVPEGGFVRNAAGFCSSYSDGGLVGINAECAPDQAGAMVEFLGIAFKGVASGVTDAECNAAKARLKLKVAGATSNCLLSSLAEDMLNHGTVVDKLAAIDAVSAADVQKAAQMSLASAPSIASMGTITDVPRYNKVQAMFN